MLIAIVNKSTMVNNADCATMVAAIQKQLDLHFLPAWNLSAGTVKFFSDATKVPGYAWTLYIIDSDAQVEGALGFHEEETNGRIDGYIMASPVLQNGGDVLKFDPANPGNYTVSGTLSHEVLEAIMDRFTNTYCDNGNTSWCMETCDAVEQIGYGIEVNGVMVAVSDFVFPNFFNPYAKLAANGPFNFLKTVKNPFKILDGGYSIERTGGPGTETQVFGKAMPQWRRDQKQKAFSRYARRVGKK